MRFLRPCLELILTSDRVVNIYQALMNNFFFKMEKKNSGDELARTQMFLLFLHMLRLIQVMFPKSCSLDGLQVM